MKFIVPLLFVLVLLPACSEKPNQLVEKCADHRTKLLMPESTQMKLFALNLQEKLKYNPGKNSIGVYESFFIACEKEFRENKITFNEKWRNN
tara:strand:+ start:477 stop:752 length:276 start_codon:yes stop_codon:yes gene_type:complete